MVRPAFRLLSPGEMLFERMPPPWNPVVHVAVDMPRPSFSLDDDLPLLYSRPTVMLVAHRVAWPANRDGVLIYCETKEELDGFLALTSLALKFLEWCCRRGRE